MLYSRKIMLASFCGECAGFLWTYKNSPRIEKRVSCAQSWLGGICIEILQPVPSQEYLHRPAYSPPIAPSEKSDVEIANQRRTSAQLAGAGEWPASSRPWWVRPRTPPFLVRCTLGGINFIEKSRFMSSSFVVEFFLFGSFSSSNEAIKTIVWAKKKLVMGFRPFMLTKTYPNIEEAQSFCLWPEKLAYFLPNHHIDCKVTFFRLILGEPSITWTWVCRVRFKVQRLSYT